MIKQRNSAKAIIIKNNKILTIKCKDPDGYFYLLPGGGQNPGETIHQALKRECMEEICCDIEIGKLKIIREYIGKNHEFAWFDSHVHQIEFMFLCKIAGNCVPKIGPSPDNCQVGIEWIELSDIHKYRLYPQSLRNKFAELEKNDRIYFGDVN